MFTNKQIILTLFIFVLFFKMFKKSEHFTNTDVVVNWKKPLVYSNRSTPAHIRIEHDRLLRYNVYLYKNSIDSVNELENVMGISNVPVDTASPSALNMTHKFASISWNEDEPLFVRIETFFQGGTKITTVDSTAFNFTEPLDNFAPGDAREVVIQVTGASTP
jgi:hypothetical protein